MKRKKLIFSAILLILILLLLASCSLFDMDKIINGVLDSVEGQFSLTNATITLESGSYTYNGSAHTPRTKVAIGTVEVPAENYTVSYANNINAGTATVTITAAGDVYKGSKSVEFVINPKTLSDVTALMIDSYTYTGAGITPDIRELKCGEVLLTSADYDIACENNVDVCDEEALCVINGKGNYTGSVFFTFSITPLSLDDAIITLSRNIYEYTGTAFEPTVVKMTIDGNDFFIPEDNFTITYSGNVQVGSASATVTGKNNCTGQAVVFFTITDQTVYEIAFEDVEGHEFDSIFALSGEEIYKPYDPVEEGRKYYTVNWYLSPDFGIEDRYFFDKMPDENITLYGRWEQETDMTFFAYENGAPDTSIDSFKELVDLFEYISFNQIVSAASQPEFYTLNYEYDNFNAELGKAWNAIIYPVTTGYGHTSLLDNGKMKFKIYLAFSEDILFEPTIHAASEVVQFNSLNAVTIEPQREEDFDDFYIESLSESYEVETSNQLYYLLEHGLKPAPKAGSSAESLYENAKEVLREIINDDMSDYEKVLAIYQWMAFNVAYDYDVDQYEQDWIYYTGFYLEGVFIDHVAVCDGIAKAFVVMCQMEGIPCVRVTGEASGTGHAWNKVKIGGQWYIIDPTWGNTANDTQEWEYLSFQHFMISDDAKTRYGCEAYTYTNEGVYAAGYKSYYHNFGFEFNGLDYDYVIESQTELNVLIAYCFSLEDISDSTMNFLVVFDYGTEINDELSLALEGVSGSSMSYIRSYSEPGIITLIFR